MFQTIAAVIGMMLIGLVFDALGWMIFPQDTPKKRKEDEKNFLKNLNAAELGNSDSQYKTGHAYATGTGVKKDYEEAYFWYRLAASSGKEYFDMPDDVAKYLTPGQIAAVDKRITNWKPKPT